MQMTTRELSLSKLQSIKVQSTYNFTPSSVHTVTVRNFFRFTAHSYCSLLPLDAINSVNITTQKTAGL